MIGKVISHYKILEKLGEGGMGVVYKAHDTKLDRDVALKFLPTSFEIKDEDQARFLQEAKAAAAINHPNVCTIFDFQEHEGQKFIIMEYIEGRTLRSEISHRQFEIGEAIDTAIQIGEALQAAHEKGIVHRDIKSDNIMITNSGQAKVMDFGLAKLRGAAKLTQHTSTIGTLAYMSPEQIENKPVDGKSDIFSFGVVLYEMLSGSLPFVGEYDSAIMYSILNEEPKPLQESLPGVSSDLLHIIDRVLEKDPDDRYQSVNDMLIDMRRLKRDSAKGTKKNIPVPLDISDEQQSGEIKRRGKLFRLFAGISIIIILFFVLYFSFGPKEKSSEIKQNSIAVMYFDNLSGDENLKWLDKGLVQMLITNLSQYENLEVVSSQRLFDLLKAIGKEDEEEISREVATQVAMNANVKHMVTGSYIKAGEVLRVSIEISEVESGKVVGADRIDGNDDDEIFKMVDNLTERVAGIIELKSNRDSENKFKFTDVSTSNLEAYKHYQKGLDLTKRYNHTEAATEFQKAIEIDSTFAIAYSGLIGALGLFQVMNPFQDVSHLRELANKALKFSYKSNSQNKMEIKLSYLFTLRELTESIDIAAKYVELYPDSKRMWSFLGSAYSYFGKFLRKGIFSYEKALELDPTYANVYNHLAYQYSYVGDHEKAISTIKKYIALQPDVDNTYDSACEIYVMAGMYEEALKMCQMALRRNSNWYSFHIREGMIYLFQQKFDKARAKFKYISEARPEYVGYSHLQIAYSYVAQGQFKNAAEELRMVMEFYKSNKMKLQYLDAVLDYTKTQLNFGEFDQANKIIEKTTEYAWGYYKSGFNPFQLFAEYIKGREYRNRNSLKQAEQSANSMRQLLREQKFDDFYQTYYKIFLAEIAMSRNDTAKIRMLSNDANQLPWRIFPNAQLIKIRLNRYGQENEETIKAYEKLYNYSHSIPFWMGGDGYDFYLIQSRIPFITAGIYEKMGNNEKAIEFYQKAVSRWKDADPGHKELAIAKERLKKLKMKD